MVLAEYGQRLLLLLFVLLSAPQHHRSFQAVLRILDVYPGSRILIFVHRGSRISDPKTATKEKGGKNLLSYLFLESQISQNFKLSYF